MGLRVGQVTNDTVGRKVRPLRRPASTWQAKDFPSCMLVFCSAHQGGQVVGIAADDLSGEPPVEWEADLVDHSPVDDERTHPPGHHGAHLDAAARRADRHPAAVDDPALGGQLRAQLDEHLRLQFVEPGIEPAHRPAQVVLGESVGGGHHGELGLGRVDQTVARSREDAHTRRTHVLGIEQVADRRLEGLVVRRQGTVLDAAGGEEPGDAVGLHDERVVAGNGAPSRSRRAPGDSRAACSARSPAGRGPPRGPSRHPTR